MFPAMSHVDVSGLEILPLTSYNLRLFSECDYKEFLYHTNSERARMKAVFERKAISLVSLTKTVLCCLNVYLFAKPPNSIRHKSRYNCYFCKQSTSS